MPERVWVGGVDMPGQRGGPRRRATIRVVHLSPKFFETRGQQKALLVQKRCNVLNLFVRDFFTRGVCPERFANARAIALTVQSRRDEERQGAEHERRDRS